MYISAEIRRQRNFRTIRVAQLFCNALSVTPPSLPTVICSDHVAEGAQSALVGLDALLREPSSVPTSEFAATILKSMPAVAVWAAYFATLPADRWPDGLGHRDVTLVKISWLIFRLLRVSESAKPKVVRTPGVVVLIASLWANEARTAANPAVYPPSTEMLLAVLQGNMSADGQLDDAILREVVATAGGGSVDEVARIAIIHVRSAGSAMAPLCASACALLELSRGDQNALRAAILDRGGVSIIAKELFKFARQDDGSDPSADHMVAACVKYILTVAETGRGLPWLRQMLEGNLLESLVKMSTRLARLEAPDQLLIANFLEDVLPRYLVYSSVVELAAKQFRKIHMAKLDSTPLRASWMALAKVLIPHARFYLALGVTKGTGCCTQVSRHGRSSKDPD
ncbi:hypothetical protein FA95DRAFT_1567967 [Auriscalpium vulgare]|uniref:Uncharacterized protein n=1 Tax=Auriscalpium vulgare TaxID=40419 RepID=A0ACB8R1G2_9AGAM|nr:hypothetical protein FA95DRAFT_1567967 [Auriscalpium vulgare]